jgi:hypothetical protein
MGKFKDPRTWPDGTKRRIASFIDKQTEVTSKTVDTPCWLWTGWTDKFGYGRFSIPGKSKHKNDRVHIYSHRLVYALSNGWVDESLDLDHLCYNRNCVRPSHLEPVTHEENIRRRDANDSN